MIERTRLQYGVMRVSGAGGGGRKRGQEGFGFFVAKGEREKRDENGANEGRRGEGLKREE